MLPPRRTSSGSGSSQKNTGSDFSRKHGSGFLGLLWRAARNPLYLWLLILLLAVTSWDFVALKSMWAVPHFRPQIQSMETARGPMEKEGLSSAKKYDDWTETPVDGDVERRNLSEEDDDWTETPVDGDVERRNLSEGEAPFEAEQEDPETPETHALNHAKQVAQDREYPLFHEFDEKAFPDQKVGPRACAYRTLTSYIRCRMKSDPRFYAHFADRKWVNHWDRVYKCGARVPKMIGYFSSSYLNTSIGKRSLRGFVAPEGGAVVKLNHQPGSVTVLKEGASLSAAQLDMYLTMSNTNYRRRIERHYQFADKGVFIEALLPALHFQTLPADYKFMCFDGFSPMVQIFSKRHFDSAAPGELAIKSGRDSQFSQVLAFDPRLLHNASKIHTSVMLFSENFSGYFEKPCGWEKASQVVECLSRGLAAVRMDVYLIDCEVYLGEVTMTPYGGVLDTFPDRQDQWLASFIPPGFPIAGKVRRRPRKPAVPRSNPTVADDALNAACNIQPQKVPAATEAIMTFAEPGLAGQVTGANKCVWLVSDDLHTAHVHDGVLQDMNRKLYVGQELFRKVPFVSLAAPYSDEGGRCKDMKQRREACCEVNFFRYRGVTFSGGDPKTTPEGAVFMPANVATVFFCEALRRVLEGERGLESMIELGAGSGAGGRCAAHFGRGLGLEWIGLLDIDPQSARFIRSPVYGTTEWDAAFTPITADAEAYMNSSLQLWVSNPPYIPTTSEMEGSGSLNEVSVYGGWAFGLKMIATLLDPRRRKDSRENRGGQRMTQDGAGQNKIQDRTGQDSAGRERTGEDGKGQRTILVALSSLSLRLPAMVEELEALCKQGATLQVVLDREVVLPVGLLTTMFKREGQNMRDYYRAQPEGFTFGSVKVCGRTLPTGFSAVPTQCTSSEGSLRHDPFSKRSGRAYERLLFCVLRFNSVEKALAENIFREWAEYRKDVGIPRENRKLPPRLDSLWKRFQMIKALNDGSDGASRWSANRGHPPLDATG